MTILCALLSHKIRNWCIKFIPFSRRSHISSERWLRWKNSQVWLLQLPFFFEFIVCVCVCVFFQTYFSIISTEISRYYAQAMPCRHASKPWHGDGSVTSIFFANILLLLLTSLGFIFAVFYFCNVLKFNIASACNSTIKWKKKCQHSSHNMTYKVFSIHCSLCAIP